jgi:hypothetical protein
MTDYATFLEMKSQTRSPGGFAPLWLPDFLFDFQKTLVDWAIRRGRAAIFADCGMGKTPMQLVWAQNVVEHTNQRVLIVTPLAVSHQTVREGEKFGIACTRSSDGTPTGENTVTNYERLHLFSPYDFAGVVCDESSILKNFDGVRRGIVTQFLKKRPYRLLCTATAAPNDYIELGTSAEALGELGYMDMLNRFFKNENNTSDTKGRYRGFHAPRAFDGQKWRFKKHAQQPFWRWLASWARAIRKPSDYGFTNGAFVLPPLIERQTTITNPRPRRGDLFVTPAIGLQAQREERGMTIRLRCEEVARRVHDSDVAVVWCHLNDEGTLLRQMIPDCTEICGQDSDERKEEVFLAFSSGQLRKLVTKPKIASFGLNWQHCNHITTFASHSFEQYYQSVRRCWRFGQTRPVTVDIVTTEGERAVMENLQRKSQAADQMFSALVAHMNDALTMKRGTEFPETEKLPSWL